MTTSRTGRRLHAGNPDSLWGLAAYLIWGSFPIYFKALVRVSPSEVLAHRILWSAVFLLIFVAATGAGAQLKSLLADRRTVATLAVTTLLIATNWFVFIYAVAAGKVLESSLGYYINPLVSIFLAAVFLGEKLTGRQKLSIVLASAGVAIQTVIIGRLPIISLTLAFTFCFIWAGLILYSSESLGWGVGEEARGSN